MEEKSRGRSGQSEDAASGGVNAVTHGLRKNATIELFLAGCDDEMVKAVTGHPGVEMLKNSEVRSDKGKSQHGAQDARNRFEQNRKET